MPYFTCEKCGEKIYLSDGFLSWQRENGALRNFQITHRECSDQDNNVCETLYKIMEEEDFMRFVKYLFDCWNEGLSLDGYESLLRVTNQLAEYYRSQRQVD